MHKVLIGSISLALGLNIWQYGTGLFRPQLGFTDPSLVIVAIKPAASPPLSTIILPPTVAPAADPVIMAQAALTKAGLKSDYAQSYLAAQHRTGTPWQLLAAVHMVETGQRGNTTITSYAGAKGPMQFMPTTFRAYGADGNGDGLKDITNLDDAVMSAGAYLASGGASKGKYMQALYRYNHSTSYGNRTLALARRIGL